MEFNIILQSIESSALTGFFKFITFFGSTTCALIVFSLIYLILPKRTSFVAITSMAAASLTTFALKLICKVPRPFNRNPKIKQLIDISGYSFPSGHSTIVAAYSTTFLKKNLKKWWLWCIFVVLSILVVLSRIYLGVHTIYDCLMGLAVGILITLGVSWLLKNFKNFGTTSLVIATLSVILMFVYVKDFATFNAEAISFLKLCGGVCGFYLGYFLERKFVNFNLEEFAKKQRIILSIIGILIFAAFACALMLFKSISILWFFRMFLVAMFLTLGVNFILKIISKKLGGKIEKAVCEQ